MGSKRQRCNRGPLSHRLALLLVLALAGALLTAGTAGNASGASLAAAWGLNDDGQLGNGSTSGPESCKFNAVLHACSLGAIPVSELSEVTAVAAGKDHSLALIEVGTVKAWGANEVGQLGNGTTTGSTVPVSVSGLTTATGISAGFAHSLAVLSGGTVKAWGYNGFGQLGNGTRTGPSKCAVGELQLPCAKTPVSVTGLSEA